MSGFEFQGPVDYSNHSEDSSDTTLINQDCQMQQLGNNIGLFAEKETTDEIVIDSKLPMTQVRIIETPRVAAFSEYMKIYQVKRDAPIHIVCSTPQLIDGLQPNLYLRLRLQRINPEYKQCPVNQVCDQHKNDGKNYHPIMIYSPDDYVKLLHMPNHNAMNASIYIEMQPNTSQETFIRFPCNCTCVSTSDPHLAEVIKGKEGARDMVFCVLVLI